LIFRELNIELPISTVGDYLAKWQFTSKKPIKRAYERKDSATKHSLVNKIWTFINCYFSDALLKYFRPYFNIKYRHFLYL
ncbi:winged helix-turn-helix domain-containing protein, partial [Aliarcobacter butzleri]